jgi:hypothetical protein
MEMTLEVEGRLMDARDVRVDDVNEREVDVGTLESGSACVMWPPGYTN